MFASRIACWQCGRPAPASRIAAAKRASLVYDAQVSDGSARKGGSGGAGKGKGKGKGKAVVADAAAAVDPECDARAAKIRAMQDCLSLGVAAGLCEASLAPAKAELEALRVVHKAAKPPQARLVNAERTLQELVEKRTKADKRASALQLELDEAKLVAAALYDKEQVALAETELCRKDVYGTADNAAAPSASDARSAPLSPAQILEAIMALPGSDDTAEAKFLRALSSPRPAQGSAGASGAASGAAVGSQKRGVTIASFAKQLAEADEDCDIDQIEELEKIVAGKRAKLGTK
jgi:hypothetical protein